MTRVVVMVFIWMVLMMVVTMVMVVMFIWMVLMYLSRKDSGSALRPLVLRCSSGRLAGF